MFDRFCLGFCKRLFQSRFELVETHWFEQGVIPTGFQYLPQLWWIDRDLKVQSEGEVQNLHILGNLYEFSR